MRREPKKILVRATNWIGDAVMSLPAYRALHQRFPQAELVVLARPWVADLYARETAISRVIPYELPSGSAGLPSKLRFAWNLRQERFDLALLFQNAFEAALVAFASGIPERIGYDRDGRGLLLSRAVKVPAPGEIPPHERYYYLELLRRAGLLSELPDLPEIRLEGAADAAQAGRAHFASRGITGPVIGISPGAAYGNAKRWLPERFAEAASELAEGSTVALFGSAAERELCARVAAAIPRAVVLNLAGETRLREFIEMAAACRLFLTNDSGAMHIASALGVPTVTVFGATNHITTGPTGERARIVRHEVPCSPCLLRECPIDHRCMTAVTAGEVVDAARQLLHI